MSRGSSWPGDGPQGDVLVVDRRRRDEAADHGRDLGRPDAGRVDDELGLDRAVRRSGRRRTSRRGPSSMPVTRTPGPDPDAERPGGVGHGVGRPVRVEVAVARQVDRTVELVAGEGGHQPAGLLGRDDLDVEPDPAGPAGGPLQLEELVPATMRGAGCRPRSNDAERAGTARCCSGGSAIIVEDGLKTVTRPAAWQVEPASAGPSRRAGRRSSRPGRGGRRRCSR